MPVVVSTSHAYAELIHRPALLPAIIASFVVTVWPCEKMRRKQRKA